MSVRREWKEGLFLEISLLKHLTKKNQGENCVYVQEGTAFFYHALGIGKVNLDEEIEDGFYRFDGSPCEEDVKGYHKTYFDKISSVFRPKRRFTFAKDELLFASKKIHALSESHRFLASYDENVFSFDVREKNVKLEIILESVQVDNKNRFFAFQNVKEYVNIVRCVRENTVELSFTSRKETPVTRFFVDKELEVYLMGMKDDKIYFM